MSYSSLEKRREFQRQYALKNPDKVEKWRLNFQNSKSDEYWIWTRAKARAKRKGLEFTISIQDIEIPEFCPVFPEIRLNRSVGHCSPSSMSIDRWDTTKGYIPGNIRIISNKANNKKSDMTINEIKSLLAYMTRDQNE